MATASTWKLLFHAAEALRNYRDRTMEGRNTRPELTDSQIRLLGCVFFRPEGSVRIKDLAWELGITPGAASQSVEKLVREGLLNRVPDPDDRRAVSVRLSPRGSTIRLRLDSEFEALLNRLTKDVPEEKMCVFREILERMIHQLNQPDF